MTLALFDLQVQAPRMESDATLSDCGTYRYRLSRRWADGPAVAFVMLNPSTADAARDDPTIRRCLAYARAWGFGALLVGNLFAYRATDPRELLTAADPIGPYSDAALRGIAREAELVVCAWGRQVPTGERGRAVLRLLRDVGKQPHALKVLGGGVPGHPLYLSGALKPVVLEAR